MRNNGASKGIRPPHESGIVIKLCDLGGQLQLAWDGCMVETGSTHSAKMTQNWVHDSGKSALRFDGDDHTGTANGEMSYNVVWNISGMVVKGDHHKIIANTVFDGSDIGASAAMSSRPSFQDENSTLDVCVKSMVIENPGPTTNTAGTHSTFTGNLMDRVEDWKGCNNSECPFVGSWSSSNMVGNSNHPESTFDTAVFDIKKELRDPWNRDFRPCLSSMVAKKGAGAYPAYTGKDTVYWIAGAMGKLASQPSPRHEASSAAIDAELLFLPAFRAVKHKIYFGEGTSVSLLQKLSGEENIGKPGALRRNTKYSWRVDAVFADGVIRKGEIWSFSTSATKACGTSASLLTGSDACQAALDDCCVDFKGGEDKCVHHTARHNSSLISAGCTWQQSAAYCSTCGGLATRGHGYPGCDDCLLLV